MASSTLSPISSGDSSSAPTSTTASAPVPGGGSLAPPGTGEESCPGPGTGEPGEKVRPKVNNSRPGSMASSAGDFELGREQMGESDDDDEDDDDDDDDEHLVEQRRKIRAESATSGSVSSSGGCGPCIAQRYLFQNSSNHRASAAGAHARHHSHSNNHHSPLINQQKQQGDYLLHHSGKRKLKQFIQSIPLPLAATSIITVFILCLLLSECKSLQVAQRQHLQDEGPGAAAAPPQALSLEPVVEAAREQRSRHMQQRQQEVKEQEQEEQQGQEKQQRRLRETPDSPGPLPDAALISDFHSGRQVRRQKISELTGQQGLDGPELAKALGELPMLGSQQTSLKREFMSGLLQQRQQHARSQARAQQLQPHQSKRNPAHAAPATQAEPDEAAQVMSPAQGAFESLGAMLFGPPGGQGASPDAPLAASNQGEPDERVAGAEPATQQASGEQPADLWIDGEPARPAHLRSSALELELGGPEQQQQRSRHRFQLQQQQLQQKLQPIGGQHPLVHQGNQYQQHHHLQQQHLSNSNHDRPFDVAQIQCNNTEEGFERFACPTPDIYGRYRCIEDRLFCDGYFDCPGGEDEERVACMYYKLVIA